MRAAAALAPPRFGDLSVPRNRDALLDAWLIHDFHAFDRDRLMPQRDKTE